jgi:hypothetical protein
LAFGGERIGDLDGKRGGIDGAFGKRLTNDGAAGRAEIVPTTTVIDVGMPPETGRTRRDGVGDLEHIM